MGCCGIPSTIPPFQITKATNPTITAINGMVATIAWSGNRSTENKREVIDTTIPTHCISGGGSILFPRTSYQKGTILQECLFPLVTDYRHLQFAMHFLGFAGSYWLWLFGVFRLCPSPLVLLLPSLSEKEHWEHRKTLSTGYWFAGKAVTLLITTIAMTKSPLVYGSWCNFMDHSLPH